jgi:hypothetical protein
MRGAKLVKSGLQDQGPIRVIAPAQTAIHLLSDFTRQLRGLLGAAEVAHQRFDMVCRYFRIAVLDQLDIMLSTTRNCHGTGHRSAAGRGGQGALAA